MGRQQPIAPGVPLVAGPLLNRRAWLDKFTHVKAMSVIPGHLGSELVAELPDPPPGHGSVLVEGLLAGICGTDAEILRGGGLDFCVNGRYTERGIKGLDGYGATRWRVSPRFAIAVPDQLGDLGVLTEPGSVVAKAWEQIDRLVLRAPTESGLSRVALVTGAGPIGMLAALLGRQRGYQVHVFDRVTAGPKPALVAALGATYHHGPAGTLEALDLCPDVALECTGAGELVVELAGKLAPAGVMCLIGVSSGQRLLPVDMSRIGASMVLGNSLVFGTVSAARRHYEQAVGALARADPAWLGGLISRRVPLSGWQQGLARQPDDVKVVVDLTQ